MRARTASRAAWASSVSDPSYLGPGVQTVDGKLISTDESKLALGVNSISMRSGQDQYWKGETVAIPRSALATVQQRKVNKPKSLLLEGRMATAKDFAIKPPPSLVRWLDGWARKREASFHHATR